jgi:uncharacterized membrane protein
MSHTAEAKVTGRKREMVIFLDRAVLAFARHWLAFFNLFMGVLIGLSLVPPILMGAGWAVPAQALYLAYRLICHQVWSRHYLLFGYPTALDHRSLAIYGSILVAGLAFDLVRARLRPLPWPAYLLFIAPMALDGFTQLFGWRESTWWLRTITGTLFGVGTVWLAYPYMEEGLGQVRGDLERVLSGIG